MKKCWKRAGFCGNYWVAVGVRLVNGLCDFMLGAAKMMLTELIVSHFDLFDGCLKTRTCRICP